MTNGIENTAENEEAATGILDDGGMPDNDLVSNLFSATAMVRDLIRKTWNGTTALAATDIQRMAFESGLIEARPPTAEEIGAGEAEDGDVIAAFTPGFVDVVAVLDAMDAAAFEGAEPDMGETPADSEFTEALAGS